MRKLVLLCYFAYNYLNYITSKTVSLVMYDLTAFEVLSKLNATTNRAKHEIEVFKVVDVYYVHV